LRTVKIHRSNRHDLRHRADGWALLVRARFHDRLVYRRADAPVELRYADTRS